MCKNWLKYYNSSNIIRGKITGTKRLTVCINDLLGMLTGVRSIEYFTTELRTPLKLPKQQCNRSDLGTQYLTASLMMFNYAVYSRSVAPRSLSCGVIDCLTPSHGRRRR